MPTLVLIAASAAQALASPNPAAPDITWLDQDAQSQRLMMLGEIHGVTGNLVALEQVVTAAAQESSHVVLALELPSADQAAMDAFWRSRAPGAAHDFVSRSQWCEYEDGRTSVELIEMLSRMKAGDLRDRITVVLFDDRNFSEERLETYAGRSNFGSARHAVSLARIYERYRNARIIASVGNAHAMLSGSRFSDESGGGEAIIAGQLLSDIASSVMLVYSAGQRYGCSRQGCGVQPSYGRGFTADDLDGYMRAEPVTAITPLTQTDYCTDEASPGSTHGR